MRKQAPFPPAATVFGQPVHFLAFGFGLGLSRRAPGTVGTLRPCLSSCSMPLGPSGPSSCSPAWSVCWASGFAVKVPGVWTAMTIPASSGMKLPAG